MTNEVDRLLSMASEAYNLGLGLVSAFDQANPAYSKQLGTSLPSQYRAELLSYLLYLCETAGAVDERSAQFIDKVLGYPYSAEELNELMKRLNLHDQDFSSLIPTSLKAAVQADEKQQGSKNAESIIRILDRIGEAFRLYAASDQALVEMDQRIYILSLTNWLQDHGKRPLVSAFQDLPDMPDIPKAEEWLKKEQEEEGKRHPDEQKPEEPEESLEDLMAELEALTGLEQVKEDVSSLINLLKIRKLRKERNLNDIDVSMHLVFTGNPGTGKTTVARLLAKIYHALGALSKGQLIEVDRSELVGGYVGQTAIKTQEVTDSALGGVLFIDEAYSLTSGKDKSDFGYEAVNTLLVEMENHRDDLAVIVAGYPELMEEFLSSNPGLKSRFNKFIEFQDYKPAELLDIFEGMLEKTGYQLDEEAGKEAARIFEDVYKKRDDTFANGRTVRNFFEKCMTAQANRLAKLDQISDEQLITLTKSDLDEAARIMVNKKEAEPEKKPSVRKKKKAAPSIPYHVMANQDLSSIGQEALKKAQESVSEDVKQ